MRRLFCSALFFSASTAIAAIPLGTKVDNGALLDVTASGFDALEGLAADFVPSQIDVPVAYTQVRSPCNLLQGCLYRSITMSSDNIRAFVTVQSFDVSPGLNSLNLDATASIRVNSAGVPGILDWQLVSVIGTRSSGTCEVFLRTVNIDIHGTADLELVPDPAGLDIDGDGSSDTKLLDVTVPPLQWSWNATSSDLDIDCGGLTNTLVDALGFFGLDIEQLILDEIESQIDDVVQGLPADLEPTLEQAFAGLVISQDFDLLGVPLSLDLWPDSLVVTPSALRLGLSSVVDTVPDPCIAGYADGGSVHTPGDPPSPDHVSSPIPAPDAVAMADDDLINHVLYAAWSGGLLCLDLGGPDSPVALPLPLDTNLLGLLAGDEAFGHLFDRPQPIGLVTDPTAPPTADLAGANDINVIVDPVGLVVTTVVDGRMARLLNVDLSTDLGVDLVYDPSSGDLDLDIGIGEIVAIATYNEFAPERSGQIEAAVEILVDSLVVGALDPYLGGLSVAVPAFEGIGLTAATVAPTGPTEDHLGLYAELGSVPFASTGCGSGGCDTSGCGGGCSTSTVPSGLVVMLFPLLVAGARRRR